MATTYRIPAANWDKLVERLEKLTRRAKKLGRKVPVLNKLSEESETDKRGRVSVFYNVQIESEPVAVAGWDFVASIDVAEDTTVGKVINRVPGVLEGTDLPAKYRQTTDYCDHCKMSRRRNSVYVLYNKANDSWTQVGRNCLGQFLGGIDPEQVVQSMEMLMSFDALCGGAQGADFFGVGGQADQLDLQSALVFTGYVIKNIGWLSRSKARELSEQGRSVRATADIVTDAYFGLPAYMGEDAKEMLRTFDTLSDAEKIPFEIAAEAAVDWIRSTSEAERNDYLHNLYVACSGSTFNRKHLGIVCSLLIAHQNTLGRLKELAAKIQADAKLTHVGTVGQRATFELTLTDVKYWANGFGGTTACFFKDAHGNIVVWKASRDPELEIGTTYQVTGKVKAHGAYNNRPQTELSHCKVAGAVGASQL